jgi:hypothetical protein
LIPCRFLRSGDSFNGARDGDQLSMAVLRPFSAGKQLQCNHA